MKSNLKNQILVLLPFYGLVIALFVFLGLQNRVSVYILARDVFCVAEVPFYTGLLQHIGVLIWCSSFAICLFAGVVLGQGDGAHDRWYRFFLLGAAMLSLLLLLDDFFVLHDEVYPVYLHASERVVYAVYAAMAFAYVLLFGKVILRTSFFYLILALAFFALSLLVDVFAYHLVRYSPLEDETRILLEDGAKLLGLVSWCVYCCSISCGALTRRP